MRINLTPWGLKGLCSLAECGRTLLLDCLASGFHRYPQGSQAPRPAKASLQGVLSSLGKGTEYATLDWAHNVLRPFGT